MNQVKTKFLEELATQAGKWETCLETPLDIMIKEKLAGERKVTDGR